MFVSKLTVMCFAVLITVSAIGKTLDTNYNPVHEHIRLSPRGISHQSSFHPEGNVISLCNLELNESYLVKVETSDCIPFLELYAKASAQVVATSLQNQRESSVDNRQFSFVANQSCLDLYLAAGACNAGEGFTIHINKKQNEELHQVTRSTTIKTFDNFTPEQLVEDVLVGGGCFEIVQGSIRSIGNPRGIGYFNNGTDAIDIEEGVVLSSGETFNAEGPNNYDATSGYLGVGFNEFDPDLSILLPGSSIFDASGLEFEFVPTSNHVEFRYVFASEEYCEFVGSRFNDVFGFFIQGPGVSGGFTGDGENIALLPGTSSQVSINSVNHVANQPYYVKNETLIDAIDCGIPFDPQALSDIEYDGFTVVLTASVDVIPCETYKIKMIVADISDRRLDSAVFLEANSFNAGGEALVRSEIPYSNDGMAFESCSESFFYFERAAEEMDEPLVVKFHLSDLSTAEVGLDFAPLPDSIIIPAGERDYYLPVELFEDNTPERAESIVLELENPCSCDAPFTEILIADRPEMEVLGLDETTCFGDSARLEAVIDGGIPGFSYSWSTGETTPVIDVFTEQSSSYFLTVTDVCGKVAIDTLSLEVLTEPVAWLEGEGQICGESPVASLPVSLIGSGPWSLSYTVNGVAQTPIDSIVEAEFQLPGSLVGVYDLTAVADNGCPGLVGGTAEIVATVMELASSTNPVSCFEAADGRAELSVSGNGIAPYNFLWSDSSTLQNAVNLAEGNYEVTVADANGCTATSNLQIVLDPEVPVAMANVSEVLTCTKTAIALDGSGSSEGSFYNYNWTTSEGNITGGATSLAPTVDEAGSYQFLVSNTKTNCIASTELLVNADTTLPTAVINELGAQGVIDCINTSVVLDGNSSAPFGGLMYTWTDENGGIMMGNDSPNPEVDKGGNYYLTVTDLRNGCKDTESVLVETNINLPAIEIAPTATLTCTDTTIRIDAGGSSTGNEFAYNWTTSEGTIDSGPNSLIPIVSSPGTYQLQITNQENGCVHEEEVQIAQDIASPLAEAGTAEEIICDRPIVDLNGNQSSTGPGFSHQWYSLDGHFTAETAVISTAVDAPGSYTLLVTNLSNGCSATDEVVVIANTNRPTDAEIIATPPLCYGEPGTVEIASVNGGVGPFVYSYDGGGSYLTQPINPGLFPDDYHIYIMDSNGCEYEETISLPAAFKNEVMLEPEVTIPLGDSYTIDPIINFPETTIQQINWTTVDSIDCSDCLNPEVSPIDNTHYSVELIDENGCVVDASILIRIDREPIVYIPTAFSPHNGDGINDKFLVFAKESSVRRINNFQIYTRWGGKVFEMNDFMPNDESYGWDGLLGTKELNPGVFVYFVEIEFIDGRKEMFSGDVTLLD